MEVNRLEVSRANTTRSGIARIAAFGGAPRQCQNQTEQTDCSHALQLQNFGGLQGISLDLTHADEAEGLILREIALKSQISYPTALKYRRRIAALASRLGAHWSISSAHKNGDSVPLELSNGGGPNEQFVSKNAIEGKKPLLSFGGATASGPGTRLKSQLLAQIKQAEVGLKKNGGKARCHQ